ncbi:hypothetical protein BN6_25700 [Saccharothrix espanaensis DSM 44229]|uniref:Uncharacterized protein n=1 Tax=Saccharothrix espanaensis (strain ATCC 51144 / DSM 44229 / JCM 9112 / NBRC 15066 / NRRL 15764) TaxID=1179773 RepID=K0JYV7_SACES|nr:hypothetical protein BN6_25700 [Saccharothrix espanaensis DSM 44229]
MKAVAGPSLTPDEAGTGLATVLATGLPYVADESRVPTGGGGVTWPARRQPVSPARRLSPPSCLN